MSSKKKTSPTVTQEQLLEELKINRIIMLEILGYLSELLYSDEQFDIADFETTYKRLVIKSGLTKDDFNSFFKGAYNEWSVNPLAEAFERLGC